MNALSVSGSHLELAASPSHSAIAAPGLPVAIPNLGPSLSSLPSALSLMLPMGIGDRGVMCELPERNYTLPPPPYPHLESSYFRTTLPGILSYLADRPPPHYIHPNSINVDGNTALSITNNPSALDPYQANGNVGLELGIVSIDSRSVNTHGAQSLHPNDGHEVALDTTITMENVSRVTSPISTDGMAEELTMDGVTGEHSQIPSGSRSHEPLSVDSVSNSLTADTVGHGGVMPIHGNGLELPMVMETDHIANRVNGMSDSTLSDSIHTVAMSTKSVDMALSTSHNLDSLESVFLREVGLSLEPVTVSSVTQKVAIGTGHVDVSSDSLSFVPSSLQMEDSNSNKENMATLFTICECASLFSSGNTFFVCFKIVCVLFCGPEEGSLELESGGCELPDMGLLQEHYVPLTASPLSELNVTLRLPQPLRLHGSVFPLKPRTISYHPLPGT